MPPDLLRSDHPESEFRELVGVVSHMPADGGGRRETYQLVEVSQFVDVCRHGIHLLRIAGHAPCLRLPLEPADYVLIAVKSFTGAEMHIPAL